MWDLNEDWNFEPPKKKKKKSNLKKKVFYVLTSMLGVIVIFLSVAYGLFAHYYGKLNTQTLPTDYEIVSEVDLEGDDFDNNNLTEDERAKLEQYFNENFDGQQLAFDDKNVTNILLLGTDARSKGNKRTRTDAMMIVSINRNTKKIVMTSLMRDTYVKITEDYSNRLNTAFPKGGAPLVFDTINNNFGIPLDKYAHVDFFSFMKLVDGVGGIDLDVSSDEIKVMNRIYITELNEILKQPADKDKLDPKKPGLLHLNGKQAVAYTRVRYVGNGDFERTERQRKVLTQIVEKAKGMSLTELNDFANVALPMVSTNLTQGEVLSLVLNASDFLTYDIVSIRLPADGTYSYLDVNGASVLGANFKKNREYWYEVVYGES